MRRRQSGASWDGEQLWTTVCVRRTDSQSDEQTVDSAVTTSLPSVYFSFTLRRRMDPTSGSHSETTSRHFKTRGDKVIASGSSETCLVSPWRPEQ